MTVPTRPPLPAPPAGRNRAAGPPAALAVDLGSRTVGVWAAQHGTVSGSWDDASTFTGTPVRRGRVVDIDGCANLLARLVHRYSQPVPQGGVVVACRPVLASEADQEVTRRVLDAVLAPQRLVFIDTVRAAAVGSGAAAGSLLVVDIGAELTEVALLTDGRVRAARRTEIGTQDLTRGATVDLIGDNVVRHVDDLRAGADASALVTALARGILLVGDGAVHPGLATTVSGMLRVRVHRTPHPAPPRCTAPAWRRCPSCATADHPSTTLEPVLLEAS